MLQKILRSSLVCQKCLSNVSISTSGLFGDPNRLKFSTSICDSQVRKAVSKHVSSGPITFGEKVKENTKTTYYTAVVVAGVGVVGLMAYAIARELLFSFSPQSIYSAAVDKCTANTRLCDLLGDDVKSYGEESRRGRRQHISHFPYEVDGLKGMRMKFHLKGQRRSGTAHLDARENDNGWGYRYIFVQIDSYPHDTIIIEDNRVDPNAYFPPTTPKDDRLSSLPPPPPLVSPNY